MSQEQPPFGLLGPILAEIQRRPRSRIKFNCPPSVGNNLFLLPPITINWVKLDLGATAPPYDGNHSTCGYLGVIWTP